MSRHALVCALLLSACAAPTKEQVIQTALENGAVARKLDRVACLMLQNDQSIPREPEAERYCELLLTPGCP